MKVFFHTILARLRGVIHSREMDSDFDHELDTLTSFTVAQRRREIGIRAALGAQPGRLVSGIFGRALFPAITGGVIGSIIASLIDYYLPLDEFIGKNIPGIVPAIAVFMIAVGLLALAGPARRAIRINSTDALRDQ